MQVVGPRFANSRKLTAQQPQSAPCFAVDAMGNSPGGFERHRVHLLQGIKKIAIDYVGFYNKTIK